MKANNGGTGNSISGIGKGSNSDPKKSGSGPSQKSEPNKSRRNADGYLYPQPQENELIDGVDNQDSNFNALNPIVLVDSEKTPIVAFLDEGPVKKSQNVEYMYDYITSFTLGETESSQIGLGFCDEVRTTIDGFGSSDEGDTSVKAYPAEMSHSESEENPGYVLIGGTKIYTQDISDEDEGEEDEELSHYEEGSGPADDCSGMSESDVFLYSGSGINDEVAADYVEGIGGIGNIINADQLVEEITNEDKFDKTVQKLGGIDIQEASREYGMKRTGLERNNYREFTPVTYAWSSALDDRMLVKDPRTISGTENHVAWPQQSWPAEAHKKKDFRWVSEEMKEQRKEMIAAKRRANMLQRGVDIHKINSKLEQIVLDGVDMHSFTPMLPRDCAMIRRLAAIYRLRCERKVYSPKERIMTVMRTHHTCMPSAPADKIRLAKLTGAYVEDAGFSVNDSKPVKCDTYTAKRNDRVKCDTYTAKRNARVKCDTYTAKRNARVMVGPSTTPQSSWNKWSRNLATYSTIEEGNKNKTGSYASSQPPSFVSSGIMSTITIESTPTESKDKVVSNSVEYGAFEMHTTGFGSKMMAKMGYVQGKGLGKDGHGISQPVLAFQRPKLLGLGAHTPQ